MANQASSPEDVDLEKAWDNLCLHLRERELEEGRRQGREAGLKAGYREGYAVGRTNAIEYGMEVGFIRGVVNYLKGRSFENNERMTKRLTTMRLFFLQSSGPVRDPTSCLNRESRT